MVDPCATGYKPLPSPARSNGWEGQYDLQGDHHQYVDTLSDFGSSRGNGNGKRKFDQDEFAKQEEVRHFDQMINDPSEHCYKVIADSVDNARTKVIFHQTKAEKCHLERIKEGESSLLSINDEKKWMEQGFERQAQELQHNLEKQTQELQHSFHVQQQSLQRSHDKAVSENDQCQQKTASLVDKLKRKLCHFHTEIQPVIRAMTNPNSKIPQCLYGLDSAIQELVYSARLGTTARHGSLHDIREKVGLPDNDSCLKLSLHQAVAVIQALNGADLASNATFLAHINSMKLRKYNIQCFPTKLYISFNNFTIPAVDAS